MSKKYYWIKLRTDFFQEPAIDYLMSKPNGSDYVVLYQMLLLNSSNNDGYLSQMIGEVIIPYDVEKIARDAKYFTVDTVRVALELYKALGLIYEEEDKGLRIAGTEKYVGCETDWAQKKRDYRERTSRGQLEDNVRQEKEIRDKRLENRDKSKDIETEKEHRTSSRMPRPSVDEVQAYITEKGYSVNAEAFVNYYESNGWKVGKNPMKDWRAAVRTWQSKERKTPRREEPTNDDDPYGFFAAAGGKFGG